VTSSFTTNDRRILKAKLAELDKVVHGKKSSVFVSFLHYKPNFTYWSLSFVRFSWSRTTDKLVIIGKISFKLDANSNLLLEYGLDSHYYKWYLKIN